MRIVGASRGRIELMAVGEIDPLVHEPRVPGRAGCALDRLGHLRLEAKSDTENFP
jgi:hypothetical protein